MADLDPRGAVAVAPLAARRAGVRVDVAELLDDVDATKIVAGLIEVAEFVRTPWRRPQPPDLSLCPHQSSPE